MSENITPLEITFENDEIRKRFEEAEKVEEHFIPDEFGRGVEAL